MKPHSHHFLWVLAAGLVLLTAIIFWLAAPVFQSRSANAASSAPQSLTTEQTTAILSIEQLLLFDDNESKIYLPIARR
jgi:hypothetical protein